MTIDLETQLRDMLKAEQAKCAALAHKLGLAQTLFNSVSLVACSEYMCNEDSGRLDLICAEADELINLTPASPAP